MNKNTILNINVKEYGKKDDVFFILEDFDIFDYNIQQEIDNMISFEFSSERRKKQAEVALKIVNSK